MVSDTTQDDTAPPSRAASRRFATATRALSSMGLIWLLPLLAIFSEGMKLGPILCSALTGAGFIGAMWYIAARIEREISDFYESPASERDQLKAQLRRQRLPSSAGIVGRVATGMGAIVISALSTFVAGLLVFATLLMVYGGIEDGSLSAIISVGLFGFIPAILSLTVLKFATETALWAARKADEAQHDRELIVHVRAAKAAQGGSLSLDTSAGDAAGGITEVSADTHTRRGALGVADVRDASDDDEVVFTSRDDMRDDAVVQTIHEERTAR